MGVLATLRGAFLHCVFKFLIEPIKYAVAASVHGHLLLAPACRTCVFFRTVVCESATSCVH